MKVISNKETIKTPKLGNNREIDPYSLIVECLKLDSKCKFVFVIMCP